MLSNEVLLWLILAGVLAAPFASRSVERNLELFLLIMAALAVTASTRWSWRLLRTALLEPIALASVVLIVGYGFYFGRPLFHRTLATLQHRMPVCVLIAMLILAVGCIASSITAIIASMLVIEAVSTLRLKREDEIRVTVIACYSIGLGAALTPVGEPPLSALVTTRMSAHFWYLFQLIGGYVAPGIVALAIFAGFLRYSPGSASLEDLKPERGIRPVILRACRVFVFVGALLLLGEGLSPLVDRYIVRLEAPVLFWVNMASAVLDNATLAAAETGPSLAADQLTAILVGLLISGGMLIRGNVPNIVAANHHGIRSREWARFGVPLGLVLMAVYFVA
jgi:predicted cation transporter